LREQIRQLFLGYCPDNFIFFPKCINLLYSTNDNYKESINFLIGEGNSYMIDICKKIAKMEKKSLIKRTSIISVMIAICLTISGLTNECNAFEGSSAIATKSKAQAQTKTSIQNKPMGINNSKTQVKTQAQTMIKKRTRTEIEAEAKTKTTKTNTKTNKLANPSVTKSNIYSGFQLVSKKEIKELDSAVMIYKHVISGAELIYMKNNDVNKFFDINFRTLPTDNTGVDHIIEHSVLCGSKNYPVKSPFLQMMKQSLSTFLNALTGSDYTMYPSGSKNEKDFQNLLSVYMDAVFYPNILKDPKIFKQEGWTYDMNTTDSELKYNGVVYSEMKGYASSPFSYMDNKINESLFPDTPYRWVSGGDPETIPTLTREKLIKTYQKYYTPSNCCIFLYGKLDIEKTLKFINDKYLSKFSTEITKVKANSNTIIPYQKPFKEKKTVVAEYSIAKEDSVSNHTLLSYNYVISNSLDKETMIAFPFLNYLLMGEEGAPLKRALKDSKIADLPNGAFSMDGLQPVYKISILNNEQDNMKKIEKIINDTLIKISKEGFNKERLNRLFNNYEIQYRTSKFRNESAGLDFDNMVMRAWLYGGDPTLYLSQEAEIAKIKGQANNKYFEKLIKKYLIDNKHASIVVLKPVQGLEEKKAAQEKQKMATYKAKLSSKELEDLVKQSQDLKKWKDTQDAPEALAKMPSLTRSDLNTEMEEIPTKVSHVQGVKVLCHPIPSNGISNVVVYFNTNTVPQDKLKYITLLTSLLGKIDTQKHDYAKLQDEINLYTQGMRFTPLVNSKPNELDKYLPQITSFAASLDANVGNVLNLYDEIINTTTFNNKDRIKQLVHETKSGLDLIYKNMGVLIGYERIGNYLSDQGKYITATSGLDFYNFICGLDKNFDAEWENTKNNLIETKKYIFNKDNFVASYTGDSQGYKGFNKGFQKFVRAMDETKYAMNHYKFEGKDQNEAVIMPTKVQYVFQGGTLEKAGYQYSPKMKVLEKIINSEYLWNEVRVKGGAYGVNVTINDTGSVLFTSSDDPNLKETLEAFDHSVVFLKNFKATEKEMTNYIIGAIGNVNLDMEPGMKGITADSMYFMGVTTTDILKQYKEMLTTTVEDIRNYADLLEKVLKQNYHCVIGGEEKIKENKGLFDSIKSLNDLVK
jgi:presequence protease